MQQQLQENADTWSCFKLRSTSLPKIIKYIEKDNNLEGNLVQTTYDLEHEYAKQWRKVFADLSNNISHNVRNIKTLQLNRISKLKTKKKDIVQQQNNTETINAKQRAINILHQDKKKIPSSSSSSAIIVKQNKLNNTYPKTETIRFWIHVICTMCWNDTHFLCFMEFLKRIRRHSINLTLRMNKPIIHNKLFLPKSYIEKYLDCMQIKEENMEKILHLIAQIDNLRIYIHKCSTKYNSFIINIAQQKNLLRHQIRFLEASSKIIIQHGGCKNICSAIAIMLNVLHSRRKPCIGTQSSYKC